MRKLALSDDILMNVEKPSRYIGNEVNMVTKNLDEVDVRFAMCFPDVYEIGMSHLGIQILYDMFNRMDGVYCERVYSPWTDLDKIMREKNIPLYAIESQDPVRDFDFLGITLQYEMCYTNCLQILDLSHIPLLSSDRTDDDPIVIGGGPCSYNPEPIADFFDIFYIGEGETRYQELIDAYRINRANGGDRLSFLRAASHISGMYVPSLYQVKYNDEGIIVSFEPIYDDVPKKVRKEIVKDLSDVCYPEKPLVPFTKAVQDRVVLEIQRGCIRGCRFCQAGTIYRPLRERSLEYLKNKAKAMLDSTGHEEITLSSLSSSDYSELEGLLDYLLSEYQGKGVNVSLPSLRIDKFSLDVMSKVQDIRKSSLTFAPEAGTQRLRNVINKGLTIDDIMTGAEMAFRGGWNRVKLYFMLGLPTETTEDIEGIAILSDQIARLYYETIPKEERQGKIQIVASSSFFVPKPFTAFQWAAMNTRQQFIDKAYIVRNKVKEMLNQKSIKYNWHEADVTILEGVFARGDRRISKVILNAYKNGCMYDAWNEYFSFEKWEKAFEDEGLSMDFYTSRERSLDEILPWDFIDIGVTKDFLKKEWNNAQNGVITPNCQAKCSGCGAASLVYEGSICSINR